MGWAIDTYNGLKTNGPDSNWRLGMFELCRAVNERQGALGTTKTVFFRGDGSESSDLSYADFLGLVTTTVDFGNEVFANLQRIQAAIVAMLPLFTVDQGRSDAYTLGTLEAAIGTSLSDDPIRANEARFWQAQRDALDLLIHAWRTVPFGWLNARHDIRQGGAEGTQQAAWDAMLGDPVVINLPSIGVNGWSMGEFGALSAFQCVSQVSSTSPGHYPTLNLSGVKGMLTEVWYRIDYNKLFVADYQTSALTITIGSTACPSAGFTGTTKTEFFQGSIADLATESVVDISVDGGLPLTVPFDLTTDGEVASLQGQVRTATVYHDIDSLLTDQST